MIDDAPRQHGGVLVRIDVLLEHDELVAAEPRHEILGPQHLAQSLGDRAEQLVAAGMTQGVVDLLELVEIDEQQRRELIGAVRQLERAIASRKLTRLGSSVSSSKRARWLILASAARRSVMSSTSTTAPPPAIGW